MGERMPGRRTLWGFERCTCVRRRRFSPVAGLEWMHNFDVLAWILLYGESTFRVCVISKSYTWQKYHSRQSSGCGPQKDLPVHGPRRSLYRTFPTTTVC